ncbi:MAG: RluA family pseudouridine synthase [Bacteroidales bacterium]|nr:RluA family pseudouridine synthase [Bacteroidales bacterium]
MDRTPIRIVFEDEHLIVIEKREGLLSVGTSCGRGEITAHRLLNNYLQNTCGGGGRGFGGHGFSGHGFGGRGREFGHGREFGRGRGTKTAQNVPVTDLEWRSGTKTAQNVPGMRSRGYGAVPRAFIVHRLDRETSGLMVFAKSEEVKLRMQENWDSMVTHRGYVAVVNGLPGGSGNGSGRPGRMATKGDNGSGRPGGDGKQGGDGEQMQGTVRSWLKENSAFIVYSSPRDNGGQLAITHYKVLESSNKRRKSLIELELETGRKNQIRVHMQELGCPIYGDRKYFGENPAQLAESKKARRLYLHAHILGFIHPVTGREMKFTTGIPRAFREEV